MARGFDALVDRVHGWLPGILTRIPRTFVGFALINSFTFSVDMALLWLTYAQLHLTYPIAVSISFGIASLLAFVLNKVLNFQAHGNTTSQSTKYAITIASNYVLWILLFSSLLEWAGVPYTVARVTAACVEGAYIYLLARFWVFRSRRGSRRQRPVDGVGALAPEQVVGPAERARAEEPRVS